MAEIWSPTRQTISDAALLDRVAAMTYAGQPPGAQELTAMLGDLSRQILSDPGSRRLPQYVALAYWLRPAALTRLVDRLAPAGETGVLRVPRGVALHLPPANVDTIFVYSWAMSVLAGNANVVRLGTSLAPDTQWLVAAVSRIVADHGQSDRQLFCHYDHGGSTDLALARGVDLRLVWGGDLKVETASRVPIRPDGLSIGFPDRTSLAIVASGPYRAATDATRDALAHDLYNDIYWFNQMGCGSPRLLVWLGDPGSLAEDLYGRLDGVIRKRGYTVDTGVALGKRGLANDLLAEGLVESYRHRSNALDICRALDAAAVLERRHGGGFLCDWVASGVEDVAALVSRKVQTLTQFGLSAAEVAALARSISGRGGYRIVPTGQALQFDPTWDGIDLFEHMTRKIVIR
ncbi:hypothetical protein GWI72_14300 [Microvirga tunisiensis]|uniref:Long-chain-fatty-acyl-CoA reductase n=1 Tax=Pannonibacter tanglangensis TaxID=2750084 RepID=A0A7X5F4M5_9HYPH|nr:acyl-CoA reductase [Pannonibacter sp. XCT-53]NBN79444.1 hypothetical protein [Pannonibacter sp. XCT-53]